MRILCAGTPEISKVIFDQLNHFIYKNKKNLDLDNLDIDLIGVYTQPDRPVGRGRKINFSPVKQWALDQNIPIYQPVNFKSSESNESIQTLKNLNPDLMIVVAYGLILPQAVLDIPKYGCWNVHVSLLPKWRGAAPIQRAIENGDSETGVSIMQMDAGLDTGPIISQSKINIPPHQTAGELHNQLALLGAEALIKDLKNLIHAIHHSPKIFDLSAFSKPQENLELLSYAHKIQKSEGELDFNLSSKQLHNKIRAFNPWPVAYFYFKNNAIRVLKASFIDPQKIDLDLNLSNLKSKPNGSIIHLNSNGLYILCGHQSILKVEKLQIPGAKPMDFSQFLNGRPDFFMVGDLLNTK